MGVPDPAGISKSAWQAAQIFAYMGATKAGVKTCVLVAAYPLTRQRYVASRTTVCFTFHKRVL